MDERRRSTASTLSSLSKEKEEIRELKVILLGEPGVGKTNIISKYLLGEFNQASSPTIGSTFGEKRVKRDGYIYSLKVWDTTGQEKYNSITKLFVKGSHIVILVYAIDNLKSFEKINFWHNYVEEELHKKKYVLGILGNKIDLFDMEVVSEEDGKNLAKEKNAIFGLVSAKVDNKAIKDYFELLLDEFINTEDLAYLSETSIKIDEDGNKKRKCC